MDWRSPCRRWSIGSTKGESEGRTAIHWFPHWRSIEAGGGYIKSVTLEDHEQALTEKGRELQQIREHEFQNGYREGEAAAKDALAEKDREIARLKEWQRVMFGTPNEEIRHAQQLDELEEKYKDLLGQAVRFAEAYRNAHLSSWLDLVIEELAEEMATKDPVYVEAQAFLKEHS